MLIRFEALQDTITLSGTVSGSRGEWKVSISAPGNIVTEDETTGRHWHALFDEMLANAFRNVNRRRVPERTPLAAGNEAKP